MDLRSHISVFIGIQFFSGNSVQKTNWQEFKNKMLLENKVEKIVIVNKEKAYIHIKEKNLGEPFFERVAKKPLAIAKILVLISILR